MRKIRLRRLRPLGLALALISATLVATPGLAEAEQLEDAPIAYAVNEDIGRIERAYLTILGRFPEQDGLTYWLERQTAGMSYNDIVDYFLASPERVIKYGADQSDADFLDQLYTDAFGRGADDSGKQYWADLLAAGTSRRAVVLHFADSVEQRQRTEPQEAFSLNVLHINDHHSHLKPDNADLLFDGVATRVQLGGFPSLVSKFKERETALEGAGANVAKIHAGDAITGTLFYSLFNGEADAKLMNEVCFDYFAPGNHEFDSGDAGLKTFLDFLADGDCNTPALAANVIPEIGSPLNPVDLGMSSGPYLRPYVVTPYGEGEYVAYIGLDIADKTQNSSSPLDSTEFLDEVATAQRYATALTNAGVNKIVLITHYQYANDLKLASMVSGIDVIIGGDSHTLLGDFDSVGFNSSGPYPTLTTDKNGVPVCVAQAWQYSAIVGELNINFDQYGHVSDCSGTPHMILGDSFMQRDSEGERQELTGDARTAVLDAVTANPNLSVVTPDATAQTVLDGYDAQVSVLEQTVIGTATEDLCLERIPNQGRSTIAGCQASTAVQGGDIQQLVAHAFRVRSFESDISIQNAGGVRIDIPSGQFTIADAYTLLPFANTLVNLEMTGAEIAATIEEGTENAVREGGSTGAYPYAAGLRWDMDLTAANGSRATNLEYQAKGTTEWVALDMAATYTVVTNSFAASGGDGNDTFEAVSDDGRAVDTALDYAKSFVDYVENEANGTLSKLPLDYYSTQSFIPAAAN